MKPCLLLLFYLLIGYYASAQVVLNGDFEKIDPKTKLPFGWQVFEEANTFEFKLDSSTVLQGKYSVSLSSGSSHAKFGAFSHQLPYAFKGRQLQLKGFIKTENVSGGYAGLWLKVDGTDAFDNMEKQNIHGTTDWKEYTITLPYDEENAGNITAGSLLVGKGKIWVDNVRLYLDGRPIENVPSTTLKALLDTTFSNSSGISHLNLNKQQISNLVLLGQIWGFVKYHHPSVTKGDINMDAELFKVMPLVVKAQNNKETCNAIEQWLDKLGPVSPCSNCKPYDEKNVAHKPDYGEIFDKTIVSESLLNRLTDILNSQHKNKSYYIGMAGVGNPEFKNELSYFAMTYPDLGYRILALFRYWNMIQYFYPYKHLIGRDWNTVLPEFIPLFAEQKMQRHTNWLQ